MMAIRLPGLPWPKARRLLTRRPAEAMSVARSISRRVRPSTGFPCLRRSCEKSVCAMSVEKRLLDREPLHFNAPILFGVAADRLFPAAADEVDPRGVDVVLVQQQTLDLFRAILTERDRAERL